MNTEKAQEIDFEAQIRNLKEQNESMHQMLAMTTGHLAEVVGDLESEKQLVELQKAELQAINDRQSEYLNTIEILNKNLTDSIRYASRVQKTLCGTEANLREILPNSFIINLPKDVVSGDFYLSLQHNDLIYIAVADCTGHGVAGSLLTIIGCALLDKIIKADVNGNPSEIIHQLDKEFRYFLKIQSEIAYEGMEVGLCIIDQNNKILRFSGAKRPLYAYKGTESRVYDATRHAIGYSKQKKEFINHEINLTGSCTYYLFSDGVTDQMSPYRRRLSPKSLQHLFQLFCQESIEEQRSIYLNHFREYRGEADQNDDIILLGFKA